MGFSHPPELRHRAITLARTGLTNGEVAHEVGVPKGTVGYWVHMDRARLGELPGRDKHNCFRCEGQPVARASYNYLLGLYLGDGHISMLARTERLRLMLDAKYPRIVEDAAALLARFVPRNRVGRQVVHDGHMVTLHAYHGHWTCLFPQHGPGKKHDREIVLEDWQSAALKAAPWPFLRGCIRSDGCVYINRTGRYEYESYDFANLSRGILELFASKCDRVGVENRAYEKCVRIYRRPSVALMLEHVGRKS
jgi:hypothetical protein